MKQFIVAVSKETPIRNLKRVPINSNLKGMVIPQADDVNKIIEFPLRVFEGYDTAEKIRNAIGFVNRQSSYYRQAAETLGLVEMLNGNKYGLTVLGNKLLKLTGTERATFVCKLLLQFPILNDIFIEISSDRLKVMTQQDLEHLIRSKSNLTGNTVLRRSKTIIAWSRWIRNNLGIVEVSKNGTVRIAKNVI